MSSHYYIRVNLSEWASGRGVHPVTAYRRLRERNLPMSARKVGRLILVEQPESEPDAGRVVAYCRVSSADQKGDSQRQAGRVATEATSRGLAASQVVSELGAGMNGHRREAYPGLSDATASVIVVEHRDRLTRFGVNHLAMSLAATGGEPVSTATVLPAGPFRGWSLPALPRTWNQVKDQFPKVDATVMNLWGWTAADPTSFRKLR